MNDRQPPHEIRCHGARQAGAAAADHVERVLRVSEAHRMVMLLPGGRSPAPMLSALRNRDLPWDRIIACPTDERLLPDGDSERNDAMLRRCLPPSCAVASLADASGHPLTADHLPWPAAVTVLGMGEDGHIASLFPGGPWTARSRAILAQAPKPPVNRISLTLDCLLDSGAVILLVMGSTKLRLYEAARRHEPEAADLPLAALLARAAKPGAPRLTAILCDDA